MKILVGIVVDVFVIGAGIWGAGALYYSPLPVFLLRSALALAFFMAALASLFFRRHRRRILVPFAAVSAVLVLVYFQIPASNSRDWQADVSVAPHATINGDLVTIYGVRNFDYRTETDFTPRWETRTYDLEKLNSADLIAVYWAGKAIAHTMISFGFAGKDYVTFSIETRKERGEGYSAIAGFFRRYELIYVVADERDVIRVRTTYRQPQEDVYVYRVRGPTENARRVFLDYVKSINKLYKKPKFYNTLTTNCTTSILFHTRMNPQSPPMSWKILLSGYVPEYLYELGKVDTSRSFGELEKASRVNERAHAADKDPDFSQRIREGLPMPARP